MAQFTVCCIVALLVILSAAIDQVDFEYTMSLYDSVNCTDYIGHLQIEAKNLDDKNACLEWTNERGGVDVGKKEVTCGADDGLEMRIRVSRDWHCTPGRLWELFQSFTISQNDTSRFLSGQCVKAMYRCIVPQQRRLGHWNLEKPFTESKLEKCGEWVRKDMYLTAKFSNAVPKLFSQFGDSRYCSTTTSTTARPTLSEAETIIATTTDPLGVQASKANSMSFASILLAVAVGTSFSTRSY